MEQLLVSKEPQSGRRRVFKSFLEFVDSRTAWRELFSLTCAPKRPTKFRGGPPANKDQCQMSAPRYRKTIWAGPAASVSKPEICSVLERH